MAKFLYFVGLVFMFILVFSEMSTVTREKFGEEYNSKYRYFDIGFSFILGLIWPVAAMFYIANKITDIEFRYFDKKEDKPKF